MLRALLTQHFEATSITLKLLNQTSKRTDHEPLIAIHWLCIADFSGQRDRVRPGHSTEDAGRSTSRTGRSTSHRRLSGRGRFRLEVERALSLALSATARRARQDPRAGAGRTGRSTPQWRSVGGRRIRTEDERSLPIALPEAAG